jgi:hypothetical protein
MHQMAVLRTEEKKIKVVWGNPKQSILLGLTLKKKATDP